jgi:chlorobactene glucosyltransferase
MSSMLVVGLGWLALIGWLLSRSVRQFAAYRALGDPEVDPEPLPSVRVVVPARNEAAKIGRCLSGLLAQRYPADRLQIVIVDDDSSDGTRDTVERLAGPDARVRVLAAGALPPGWIGKPHACWRGACDAAGEWLCFMDADTAAEPTLLRAAVRQAAADGLALLSLEPRQELQSFWERVIIPSGLLLISFAIDLRRVNRPGGAVAVDGQFLLIRADVYRAVGGHAGVRGAIVEDKALGEAVQEAGHRIGLMSAGEGLRVRMYAGLGELWEGLAKNAVDVVGSRWRAALVALGALGLGWGALLLPIGLALGQPTDLAGACLATAGSLALFGCQLAGTRYFRTPLWYGFLLPLGFTMVAAIALGSVWADARGVVAWKGRAYPVPPRQSPRAG